MKNYISIIIVFLSINSNAQSTGNNKSGVTTIAVKKPYTTVQKMPEFPGGQIAMMNFIQSNLKYPETAKASQINGKCFIKFIVTVDGNIDEITVVKGVPNCPECDNEAKRVISIMPKWIPGINDGKTVAVYYNLPIGFRFN